MMGPLLRPLKQRTSRCREISNNERAPFTSQSALASSQPALTDNQLTPSSKKSNNLPASKCLISGLSSLPKRPFKSTPPVTVGVVEDTAVEAAAEVGVIPVASSSEDGRTESEETADVAPAEAASALSTSSILGGGDAADDSSMAISPPAEVASALGASSTLDGDGSAGASLLLLLGAGLGAGLAGAARAAVQQWSVTKRGREWRGAGGDGGQAGSWQWYSPPTAR
jgi:hypothetical protein